MCDARESPGAIQRIASKAVGNCLILDYSRTSREDLIFIPAGAARGFHRMPNRVDPPFGQRAESKAAGR
jgi:hypothetical protein